MSLGKTIKKKLFFKCPAVAQFITAENHSVDCDVGRADALIKPFFSISLFKMIRDENAVSIGYNGDYFYIIFSLAC